MKKETIDASLPSIVGAPVIIEHKDVTDKNADELRCGVISNATFNEFDGWYYVEGIIWDEKAQELINKGWSVSCSYDFLAFNDEGGEENNIHYDKEFTQLNFTHLAIVNNPRYERANIVFNSKVNEERKDKMILNALKDFIAHIDNERDSELGSDKGKWITINGNHVFIRDGQTLDEVFKERGWDKKENKETKKDKNQERAQKAFDLAEKVNKGGKLSQQDKDWLNSNKSADELNKDRQSDKDRIKIADLKSRKNEILKEYWEAEEGSSERERLQYNLDAVADEIIRLEDKNDKQSHSDTSDKNIVKSLGVKDSDSLTLLGRKYGLDLYDWSNNDEGEIEMASFETKNGMIAISVSSDSKGFEVFHTPEGKISEEAESKEFNNLKDALSWAKEKTSEKAKDRTKTNNSKGDKEMQIINKLQKLINSIKNDKENETMVVNEKVDKRKLIDEVAGIMKSAGCDDEDIRTAIGKMEKIGYDNSEASADNKKVKNEDEEDKKADNKKVKNEEEEDDKKVDNEEEEEKADELKKDVKEDVDNKCKNSKSSFDRINAIYNSVKALKPSSTYVSRQEKLDNAVEYFKN